MHRQSVHQVELLGNLLGCCQHFSPNQNASFLPSEACFDEDDGFSHNRTGAPMLTDGWSLPWERGCRRGQRGVAAGVWLGARPRWSRLLRSCSHLGPIFAKTISSTKTPFSSAVNQDWIYLRWWNVTKQADGGLILHHWSLSCLYHIKHTGWEIKINSVCCLKCPFFSPCLHWFDQILPHDPEVFQYGFNVGRRVDALPGHLHAAGGHLRRLRGGKILFFLDLSLSKMAVLNSQNMIMKTRNETRRSRTLKGIGTKAFGFHKTAITVPPCGSQKKSARSPKASWKLTVS